MPNNNNNSTPTISIEKVDEGLITIKRANILSIYSGVKAHIIGEKAYIDGKEIIDNDPRFISSGEEESAPRSTLSTTTTTTTAQLSQHFSAAPTSTSTTTTSSSLNKEKTEIANFSFSDYTQQYIDGFQKQISLKEKIEALKLTKEEQQLFDRFICPYTTEIAEVPVILHDQCYDSSIIALLKEGKDIYGVAFHPFEVVSGRPLLEMAEILIEQVKNKRLANAPSEDKPLVSSPGLR